MCWFHTWQYHVHPIQTCSPSGPNEYSVFRTCSACGQQQVFDGSYLKWNKVTVRVPIAPHYLVGVRVTM